MYNNNWREHFPQNSTLFSQCYFHSKHKHKKCSILGLPSIFHIRIKLPLKMGSIALSKTKQNVWVAQLVEHPTLDFSLGHDLTSGEMGALCQHGPCLGFSLSLSLCLTLACLCTISQNKQTWGEKKLSLLDPSYSCLLSTPNNMHRYDGKNKS